MAQLRGLDVSDYQATTILKTTPDIAFGIVKATEGTGFVAKTHGTHVAAARARGLLVGHYHFAHANQDATAQADFFVNTAQAQKGEVLVLDFEPYRQGVSAAAFAPWVVTFALRVKAKTGAMPWLYADANMLGQVTANASAAHLAIIRSMPLWKATYSAAPGALMGWSALTAWQYSSTPVDQDWFYGDAAAWKALGVGGTSQSVAAAVTSGPSPAYARYLSLLRQAGTAATNLGYDQGQRFSFADFVNNKIIPNTECDCSALSLGLAKMADYGVDMSLPVYTGSARAKMTALGWPAVAVRGWSVDQLKVVLRDGDMLLCEAHHVATFIDGKMLSANIDENGHAIGGAAGDQTGQEVNYRDVWVYSHGWDYILQCPDARAGATQDLNQFFTIDQIKAVQTVLGVSADGVIGPQTISALEVKAGFDADGQLDMPSDTVKKVQTFLNSFVGTASWCTYAALTVDGIAGPATAAAIAQYVIKGKGRLTNLSGVKL